MSTPRLLVANLDCESEFAALMGAVPGEPPPLSGKAARLISAFGTLLRVFARPGDRLATPLPSHQGQLVEVEGLPRVRLEHHPQPADEVLAWSETPSVARLRRLAGSAPEPLGGVPLWDLPWHIPPASCEVVARVNDRAFCLETARQLGCTLPGSCVVSSFEELARSLGTLGAGGGGWVLKACFSAAGRHRLQGRGASLGGREEEAARGLFRRHGRLLLEPWCQRLADFGCVAAVSGAGPRMVGVHQQKVDPRGQFRGVQMASGGARPPGLSRTEAETLTDTAFEVGRRLAATGYLGPFGIDAWRYLDAAGEERFHALGEINARLTFGFIAHALAARLLAWGDLESGGVMELHLTTRSPPPSIQGGHRVIELLRPQRNNPARAWLTVGAR